MKCKALLKGPLGRVEEPNMSDRPAHAGFAPARRWLGVGHSARTDAHEAGLEAATAAVLGDDPALLVVFAWDGHDLGALLAGIRERAGDVPLIGCTTSGEISTATAGDQSVVVTAFGGPGFVAVTAGAQVEGDDLRRTTARVAQATELPATRPHEILLLLSDGLAGDQSQVVRGAYEVVGASVPLVGGCAGDGLKMTQTFQLVDDRVLSGAVVGARLGSDAPMGIGWRHGWRRRGEPAVVTRSDGVHVHTLDGEPALDFYLRRLDAPAGIEQDPSTFASFAQLHPLGLKRRSAEEVRFVAGADLETRGLVLIADAPEGALVWLMEGDERSVLEATDAACSSALDALRGEEPLGFLAFDCIARRGVLGDQGVAEEVRRIAEHAVGAPVAGFYTYGEIARVRGMTGFHNQTLVVLAVS